VLVPHANSKTKEHLACLECHLTLWRHGDVASLLTEGKCIQDHLETSIHSKPKPKNIACIFDHHMSEGKVSAALKLLSDNIEGGILSLDSQVPCRLDSNDGTLSKTVKEILVDKYPPGYKAAAEYLLEPGCVNSSL